MSKTSFNNFKGVTPVQMIAVLEGNGTPNSPYRVEQYIYDQERNKCLGVVRDTEEISFLEGSTTRNKN